MEKERYIVQDIDSRIEISSPNYRVCLQQFTPADALEIFDLINTNRPHLSQHDDKTALKYPTVEAVLDSITNPSNPDKLRFAIRDEQSRLVGSINLTPDNEDPSRAEIGYYLGAQYTGQGNMTEAALLLTEYAFEELGYTMIFGKVHPDNIKSAEVLKRAGYVETGSKGEHVVFSIKKLSKERPVFYNDAISRTTMIDIGGMQENLGRPINDNELNAVAIKGEAVIFGRSVEEQIRRWEDAGLEVSDATKTILRQLNS